MVSLGLTGRIGTAVGFNSRPGQTVYVDSQEIKTLSTQSQFMKMGGRSTLSFYDNFFRMQIHHL